MARLKSATALLWLSIILLAVGVVILDPAAGFFLVSLAGGSALGAIALGDRRIKLMGAIALVISFILAFSYWPEAKDHMSKYRERGKRSEGVAAPLLSNGGAK
jgi:hypothetical protein